jgi:hypothetical protein
MIGARINFQLIWRTNAFSLGATAICARLNSVMQRHQCRIQQLTGKLNIQQFDFATRHVIGSPVTFQLIE